MMSKKVYCDRKKLHRLLRIERPRPKIFFMQIMALYLYFLVCFYCFYVVGAAGYTSIAILLCCMLVGIGQYVLAQALHEAWHIYFKGAQKKLSVILISYPLGIPISARDVHLDHHRYFGDPKKDPDYAAYTNIPQNGSDAIGWLFKSLFGLSAAYRFLDLLRHGKRKLNGTLGGTRKNYEFLGIALVQLAILFMFSITLGWQYYLILWIFPIVSIVKTLTNIRLIIEHNNGAGVPVLRSFTSKRIDSMILGAYGFRFHAEHHLFPTAPSFSLNKLRETILIGSVNEANSVQYTVHDSDYIDFLMTVVIRG